jgi:hypothetical protein
VKKTFEAWMAEVDAYCRRKCGLSVYDLEDCNYRDWYEDGVSLKGAASKAIRLAMCGE